MKRYLLPALLLITGITLAITFLNPEKHEQILPEPKPLIPINYSVGNPYDKDWKKVDSLTQLGLPQSALEIIEKIYKKALQEKNDAQIIKALIYKMGSQYSFEEDAQVKSLIELEKELPKINYPAKPVVQSLLASTYWRYYQIQRYQIQNRTETSGFIPDDIHTWDASKFVSKTSELYFASLQNADSLKRTSIGIFDSILVRIDGSKVFRPTLYDFLAHRALEFYTNSESGLTQPAYSFHLQDADYFENADKFVKLKISTKDSLSFQYNALLILQNLISFHLENKNTQPLVDDDLIRLKFVHQNSINELKDSLYLAALKNLESQNQTDTIAGHIGYEIAQQLFAEGGKYNHETAKQYRWLKKAAYEKCEEVIRQYPNTVGADNCQVLMRPILAKSISLQVEKVNAPGSSFRGLLEYQNVNEVWFRLIKVSAEDAKKIEMQRADWDTMLSKKIPLEQWSLNIPVANDYLKHSIEIKLPALDFGLYYILVSSSPEFMKSKEPTALTAVGACISNMSFINRRNNNNSLDFYVTDRTTGKPLKDVIVQAYEQQYDYTKRNYEYQKAGKYRTDKDGYFIIPSSSDYRTIRIELTYKDDYLFEENAFYTYREPDKRDEWYTKTFFFLDRAIYRPGQTVYFKGLVIRTNGEANEIRKSFSQTVALMDVNYQKVSELKLTTNDFGTFSGTFTLPQGLLNGNFTIKTEETGSKYFRVEDYKRPKFEVTFKPVTGSFRLNDSVTVEGSAVSYAGANLSDAQVQYRVKRQAIFPFWGWYFYKSMWPPQPSEEMEITSGIATTDASGNFKITFKAIPDPTISKSTNPVFNYTVYADVTDINGETQSNETIASVGYQAMQADISLNDVLFTNGNDSLRFATKNLNGQPENSKGTIAIYKLKESDRLMRERLWNEADTFLIAKDAYVKDFPLDVYQNEDQFQNWERENKVFDSGFNTETSKALALAGISGWKSGKYVAELLTKDKFGNEVKALKYFTVYNPSTKEVPYKTMSWFYAVKDKGEPGETAKFLIGSSAKDVKVLYEIFWQNSIICKQWIDLSNEVKTIEIPIEESYRGNFAVSLVFTRNSRNYSNLSVIDVPFTNKELKIETTTFRDKLTPGQKEEWRLKISGPKGEKIATEMLAGMYDASLDAFVANNWNFSIYPSYYYYDRNWQKYTFGIKFPFTLSRNYGIQLPYYFRVQLYDKLNWFLWSYFDSYRTTASDYVIDGVKVRGNSKVPREDVEELNVISGGIPAKYGDESGGIISLDKKGKERNGIDEWEAAPTKSKEVSQISPRKNLQETAFFFPDLKTDEQGNIIFSFTAPEALTRWKFMGFAHTQDLKMGFINKETVTQKELMVMPNPPRFFRENDKITFSAKISNLAEKDLSGKAQLLLFDALTMKPVDVEFGNAGNEKTFSVKKGGNATVSWDLKIPEGTSAILYRVLASAENFSDGEENALPVLTNRMLVTETLPLNVRGGQTKQFKFDKLINSGQSSSTLRNQKLTLEFTSNPAWYAIQALTYMMEYPYECAEQIFNRYYANAIASGIANSNPRIKQVFVTWKNVNKEALVSNLEKNQELKSLLLEETPWVLDAQSETERKKRVALLFDLNKMASEKQSALKKLSEAQTPNGGWAWFKGMPDNRYITQYIVTGIGRLSDIKALDLKQDPQVWEMVQKAVPYLDNRILEDYNYLKEHKIKLDQDNLGYEQVQYLYARTMFPDISFQTEQSEAFKYYMGQAEKYWLTRNKYSQGMIALALQRNGKKESAQKIVRSLKETSLSKEEMGMYWKDHEGGYYWYQAPIETQSLLIEAFKVVADDKKSVDEMRIWLLKQKQTQDWGSTKATADACYALLLEGTQWLDDSKLADITVGGTKVEPAAVEAGTGYFKTSWDKTEIKPVMGNITVSKTGEGISWGAMYWQYFEQLDKITPAETPLKLKKQLFLQTNSDKGPVITPVTDKTELNIGDLIKVRIELRVDRDMEFVQMKDMRAAGFEPTNVLSGYRWQGGLGYYESTRDAATNFFFDWLPKGTYVFEYSLRVSQKGDFSNGITTIQCMYAPEFASHSEGIRVKVE